MILHTVNKSSFNNNALSSCARVATDKDSILLIEDGVYAILSKLPCEPELFALKSHLETRGLMDKVPNAVTIIDFPEFVELSARATAVQSWY